METELIMIYHTNHHPKTQYQTSPENKIKATKRGSVREEPLLFSHQLLWEITGYSSLSFDLNTEHRFTTKVCVGAYDLIL